MFARRWQSILVLLVVNSLFALSGGCHSGTSTNGAPSWLQSIGSSSSDTDRHAKRLVVRPVDGSLAVGKQMILIATVYDDNDKPRPKKRVEWKIEGPGIIFSVDEGGLLHGRGFKEDSKSAVGFTDSSEQTLPKGIDNPLGQTIHPGQTWCVVTSAVEGQTVVTAYAPEIAETANNHVPIRIQWIDASWQFPQPAVARAGSEFVLATKINRRSDSQPVNGYKIRYTLLDGPASALYPVEGLKTGTPREVIVSTDADGSARASIAEQKAEFGSSRIGIEVLRPDSTQQGGFAVVAKSETKIDWQAPQVTVGIDAPKASQIKQAFPITYSVTSNGEIETQPMVLKAVVPANVEVVSATPKATSDGNELLWSLPMLPSGQQHTVQVIYRSAKSGNADFTASVRTAGNLRSDKTTTVLVTEARLDVSLTGPPTAYVGENLPYTIVVKNPGSGPATNVRIKAQFDAGLEIVGKGGTFEVPIDKLESGQTQTIALSLTPKQPGRSAVKATAIADGNLLAESTTLGLDVKKPELKLEAYGPARGYVNQEITWTVRVFNPSDVPLSNVKVRALLPRDFAFKTASNDGKYAKGAVEWNLGTAVGKQWTDVKVTAVATRLGVNNLLTATIEAVPLANRNGEFKPVSMVKPFALDLKAQAEIEILGVPALQLDVTDSADPVQVGQNVTYTIRIKNTGTLQANKIEISADLPPQMKPLRAFGQSNGKVDGQHITFPAIDSILPNIVSVFTIEAQAISEGDGRFQAEVKSLSLGSPIRTEEATRILPKGDVLRRGP